MTWENRIVRSGYEDPEQLLANPFNWRIHTYVQEQALESVLDAIGWIDRVKVNLVTGHIINGHLRVSLAIRREEPTVPVDYVELTVEEEALALATYDYLGGMAITDGAKLHEILDEAEPMVATLDDPKLGELGDMLRDEAQGALRSDGGAKPPRRHRELDIDCPECGAKFTHDLEED